MNRNQKIIRTSLVGFAGNLLLAGFKFVVGTAANSVSIRADALNNATDALSSVITIIGTRLSEKEPDRQHPFGYGRIEYFTSLMIGMMILYAGAVSFVNSFKRILHPAANDYSVMAMVIMAVAVLVKVFMGLYTRKQGKKLDSGALVASGEDSLNDSGATAAALVAALLYVFAGLSIEAYVGLAISCLILRTGFQTLIETVSSLLGERIDIELASAVKRSILSFPEVDGVFDLTVHNYGRQKLIGSAHIEVSDQLRASWIDNLQRAITRRVLADTGVEMMGITIYAVNSRDREAIRMRETIRRIAEENSSVRGMHGFYLDRVDKVISFEVETDFGIPDKSSIRDALAQRVLQEYPEYSVSLQVNHNIDE